jgi:hypothetical protein
VTPGAAFTEWRCVRSQRQSKAGWFVQGGHHQLKPNGHNGFVVGAELHFTDHGEALAALTAKKQPTAA